MRADAPFTLDHAGFTAEFRATREERGWSLSFVGFAPLWSAFVCFGAMSEGLFDGVTICLGLTVPFIWFIAWIGVEAAITRSTLQLANGQLLLVTRRIFTTRQKLDLRGAIAEVHEQFTNKGGRLCTLGLVLADGRNVGISANNWRTPDLQELAGLLNACAASADPETALVPPAALQALRSGVSER